jgi:hypothetical protein
VLLYARFEGFSYLLAGILSGLASCNNMALIKRVLFFTLCFFFVLFFMSLTFIQIHKQIFQSILGYLESWADRQNLAFASKAHYNFCLQYRENTPPFTTDQLLRVSCTQFVLTTITSINIHRSDIDKPLQFKILIRLINNAPHLNKIVSNLPGKRVIKSISEALINRSSKTELSVFAFKGDMVKWHQLLDSQIRNKTCNVKIFMIDSEDSSSSSSSSEESEDQAHVTPLKRKISLYETPPKFDHL